MIYLLATSALWGLSFAISKMALTDFSPSGIATLRLALGFVTVVFLAPQSVKKFIPISASLVGIFQFGLMYQLYISSLQYLPSGVVGMLTLFTPLSIYVLGLMFGQTKWRGRAILAIVLSVVGGFLSLPSSLWSQLSFHDRQWTGVALILSSNLSFSLGNIYVQRYRTRGGEGNTVWGQLIGALVVFIYMISHGISFVLHPSTGSSWSWTGLWPVLYLGILPTGLGFLLWNRGVMKSTLVQTAVASNLKGPLSLVFGFLLLREPVSWVTVLGTLVLFAGALALSLEIKRGRTKS